LAYDDFVYLKFGYFASFYVSLPSNDRQDGHHRGGCMRHWIAWGCLVIAGAAQAGQADVCYSPTVAGDAPDRLTAATVLECPQVGRHTLAQLAQAGWSVASVQPTVVEYGTDPATHTPRSSTAWMVIVQREAR
jgi:hypothetical protein